MSRIPRSWLYAALLPDWPPPALTRPVNHIPLRLTVHYSMVEMAGIKPASVKDSNRASTCIARIWQCRCHSSQRAYYTRVYSLLPATFGDRQP
jgi:hypothetical protein